MRFLPLKFFISISLLLIILHLTSCLPQNEPQASSPTSYQPSPVDSPPAQSNLPTPLQNLDQPATVLFYLCPEQSCPTLLSTWISHASTASCAFYSLSNKNVISALQKTTASMVLDNNLQARPHLFNDTIFGPPQHTMHNKFCILDNFTVATGSYNPSTQAHKDLLIRFEHPIIRTLYSQEFQELHSGVFGGGNTITTPLIPTLNGSLRIYFCPDDPCEETVVQHINHAQHTILMEAYSFTSNPIQESLQEAHMRGVKIAGVLESSQDRHGIVDKLSTKGLEVQHDTGKGLMHRKIFIIDTHTVITGSPNPTYSGYHANDENMIVLDDPILAGKLQEELLQELCTSFDNMMLPKQFLEALKFRC